MIGRITWGVLSNPDSAITVGVGRFIFHGARLVTIDGGYLEGDFRKA